MLVEKFYKVLKPLISLVHEKWLLQGFKAFYKSCTRILLEMMLDDGESIEKTLEQAADIEQKKMFFI